MTRRKLRPDEVELWRRVAAGLQPLRRPRSALAEALPLRPDPPAGPLNPRPNTDAPWATSALPARDPSGKTGGAVALAPFRIGAAARPAEPPAPKPKPPRLDAGMLRMMKRGRRAPDARLDLHGLTLAEAHAALGGFLFAAHVDGRRLVLVITGKGSRSPDGADAQGAIRRELPFWLARPPLAGMVQEVVPAHHRHGGAGALYVYLRRPRPRP